MKINANISALTANKYLLRNERALTASMGRLSSGYKLNSAKDSPAGMAISKKMRAQINGISQAGENATNAQAMIDIADSGMAEITTMIQRLRELAVQSANGTNTDEDREAINKEVESLKKEIDRIASDTEYNTKGLLDGSMHGHIYSDDVDILEVTDKVKPGNLKLERAAGDTNGVPPSIDLKGMTPDELKNLPADCASVELSVPAGTTVVADPTTNPPTEVTLDTPVSAKLPPVDANGTPVGDWKTDDGVTYYIEGSETYDANKPPFTYKKLEYNSKTGELKAGEHYGGEDATLKLSTTDGKSSQALGLDSGAIDFAIPTEITEDMVDANGEMKITFTPGSTVTIAVKTDANGLVKDANGHLLNPATDRPWTAKEIEEAVKAGVDDTKAEIKNGQLVAKEVDTPPAAGAEQELAVDITPAGAQKAILGDDYKTVNGQTVQDGTKIEAKGKKPGVYLNGEEVYAFDHIQRTDQGDFKDAVRVTISKLQGLTDQDVQTLKEKGATDAEIEKLEALINTPTEQISSTLAGMTDAEIGKLNDYLAELKLTDSYAGRTEIRDKETGELLLTVNSNQSFRAYVPGFGQGIVQNGGNAGQQGLISIGAMDTGHLFIADLDMSTQNRAVAAIDKLDNALAIVSLTRSEIGAVYNGLDARIRHLDATEENLEGAISRIMDTDMAREMTEYTKYNVLQQAGTSALSQANEIPQMALQLLS